MPAYEYECRVCLIRLMTNRSIHSESPDSPICCNEPMGQIYHAPSIQLKGKGWGGQ